MRKLLFFIVIQVKNSSFLLKQKKIRRCFEDETWNLNNFHLIVTGKSRESVRCMINVGGSVWCGVANRIYVIDGLTLEIRVCLFIRGTNVY